MEEWKSIPGYEGLYEVSNLGRVRSVERCDRFNRKIVSKILKPNYVSGYLRVGMYKNKTFKYYLIHRLVAQAFLPNPDNLPQVNHKDEDKSNNRVDNLEWCDRSYNMNYGTVQQRRIQTNINNGKYWFLGQEEFVSATAGTAATGVNRTDGNKYTITLTDYSSSYPYEVTPTIVADLIAA